MALNFDSGFKNFDKFGEIVITVSSKDFIPVLYEVPFGMLNRNFAIVHCRLYGETIAYGVYERGSGELKYRRGITPVKLKIGEGDTELIERWLDRQTLAKMKSWTRNVKVV